MEEFQSTNEGVKQNNSWWKQRTRLERRGVILIVIAILIIIGLIIAVIVVSRKNKKSETESICLTEGCVEAAAEVLKNLDESADPCDDFYQFACGGYIDNTDIPPDKSSVNKFQALHDTVQKQLKGMFEEPPKVNELRSFTLVKTLYNVCMNITAIEAEGTKYVRKVLKDAGGWPLLEGGRWNEQDFEWKAIIKKFRQLGLNINSFFGMGVMGDPANSTKQMLMIDQAAINVDHDKFIKGFEDPIVKAYYQYLVDFAIYLGADRRTVENDVQNVIMFIIEITKISLPVEERRNIVALYNPMTVAELQKKYPGLDWLDYINSIIGREDKYIDSNEKINLMVPSYINNLLNLLRRTSKRDQANYAFFQAALPFVDYLPDDIRNREQQYMTLISGATMRPPRWVECTELTSAQLNLAASAMYVRHYFHEDTKRNVLEMVEDIRNVFIQMMKDLIWMDEETKKTAIDKALAIRPHIGYPSEFLDDKILEKFYANLTLSTDSYVRAMNAIDMFNMDVGLNELKDPINKTSWRRDIPATTINAQYDPQSNSIRFPAAILQGVFFDKDRPQYMNYGAIAYIIGHEITHGFDNQGRLFDKIGNLKNWWANGTDKAYKDKIQCIIDQYSAITLPGFGVNLNGVFTQGENTADDGGIKEAYLAYNRLVERKGEELPLPGLNYTAKQMFWISAANVWCAKVRPESLLRAIHTDTHSPMRYRVLVPFGNSGYFAKDFNCPLGSKMNPKHKCRVW